MCLLMIFFILLKWTDTFNNSIHVDNLRQFENKSIINRTFWLGTDKFGRDVLSRLVIGARISFFIGFISVLISLVIGLLLGGLSGYYSGNIDRVIMWIINVTWSIPTLLLVIAITLSSRQRVLASIYCCWINHVG